MKVVVIGLGSMGKRRIRLLQKRQGCSIVGVDLSKDRRSEVEQELGAATYETLGEALGEVSLDAALICTSPLSHASLVSDCLDCGLHVFTELNLVSDGYESNMQKARDSGRVWFPSSTFVHRQEMKKIKEIIGGNINGAWTYHVGQYLPDWHPWESYKDFFVADARTSGIRELLAIELPWLVDIFGPIAEAHYITQKITDLDILYDDAAVIAVKHESGAIGSLLVDVACRRAVRNFSFTNEVCYIEWDGTPEGLRLYDVASQEMVHVEAYGNAGVEHHDGYARFIVENAYEAELDAFIRAIENDEPPQWGLEEDERILRLIDKLEGKR